MNRLTRLRDAVSLAVRRRDSLAVLAGVTAIYLLGFTYATGDLRFGRTGWSATLVSDPLSRMFEPGPGPFTYEPIAVIETGVATVLFSPLDLLLASLIALLVGINLSLSYLAVKQPRSCGLGAGSGVAASVPALLSGSACCAPVLLIVLGIQAGGLLLAAVIWLLPVGLVALVASLVYVAGQIDPAATPA